MVKKVDIVYHEGVDDYNTGNATETIDGGWVINPKSTFPLTTYGLNRNQINNLKQYLDEYFSSGSRIIIDSILPIISCNGFRCKEVEDYINEYKPKYLKQVEKLKTSSKEWDSASEEEREELLDEFRSDALECIDKQPYCDFLTLFNTDEKDITHLKEIISI
ncbi:MAG: hypothetical protein FJ134_11100 [Deltaproteobacteria bacterium]|nr:hypothetical protein [Deltaproteobacteria bacterium]